MHCGYAREEAEEAVNRLFRAVLVDAGEPDPQKRLFTRAALAKILRVPPDKPASQRWPSALRSRYLEDARSRLKWLAELVDERPPSMPLTLRSDGQGIGVAQPASALSTSDGPSILAGRTGMGKSTAGNLLRRDAALGRSRVLPAHAEAYLRRESPSRPQTRSPKYGDHLPAVREASVVGDRAVTFLINGVSEVPEEVRRVGAGIARPCNDWPWPRIVLLGRDLAFSVRPCQARDLQSHIVLADFIDQRGESTLLAGCCWARLPTILRTPSASPGVEERCTQSMRRSVTQRVIPRCLRWR